jgi:hypothetical protein
VSLETTQIYISDGSTWSRDQSCASLKEKIRNANALRNASIEIICIGLDVRDANFEEMCGELCSATCSRNSMYLAAYGGTAFSVEDAFDHAKSVVNSGTSFDGNRLKHGLTMEKF